MDKKLVLFPGVWLVGTLLICLSNAYSLWAAVIGSVVGIVCLVKSKWLRPDSTALRVTVNIAAAILIIVCSTYLVAVYEWVTWNPIGSDSDAGWGPRLPLDGLDIQALPEVSNGHGVVVSTRRTLEGFLSVEGATYYVFVHQSNEDNDAKNLIFRYDSTEAGIRAGPTVHWINASSVTISIAPGELRQVTRQSAVSDGVRIEYELPSATDPPALSFWQRPFPWPLSP